MNSGHYRREVFVEQIPLVYSFTKHLLHHRTLMAVFTGKQFRSSFWVDTADAHLLQACIHWCMVFGNYDSNKTHWHNLAVGPASALRESFRKGISEHLGITEAEWKIYWDEMVGFRDQYIAHRDFAIQRPVPVLERALEAAFFYDSWVRQLIAPDILDERPLMELYAELKDIVALEVEAAVQASANNR